jgi:hypothetical protein
VGAVLWAEARKLDVLETSGSLWGMSTTHLDEVPKVLILACFTCNTMEEIWYDDRYPITKPDGSKGHDQKNNPFLPEVLKKHPEGSHPKGLLFDVPTAIWQTPSNRKQIIEQLRKGSPGLDVFGTKFYDTKATYSEDALNCYKQHNRPEGQCPDYKSDKKLIKPDTASDRIAAGLDPKKLPKAYLCDFCPVKSYNMKKFNESKGLYK